MNSNYGRSTKSSFDFDLGINSTNSRSSLNDQKNKTTTSSYNTTSSWQSSTTKPSWTHQPSAPTHPVRPGSLNGPTSMVGDIMGKSWASLAPANSANNTSNNIGTVNKNPNLFGDLVGPALGNKTGGGNVHLKNAAAPVGAASKGGFSMGGMADTLPKTGSSWGYNGGGNVNVSNVGGNFKSPNLGGPSMMSSGGNGVGGGMKSSSNNKDPFGSLVDFDWKPAAGMKNASKVTVSSTSLGGDDGFGDFQKAPKPSGSTSFSSSGLGGINSSSMGSSGGGAYLKMDDFGFASAQTRPPVQSTSKMGDFGFASVQPPVQSTGVDDFDVLLSLSAASVGGGAKSSDGLGSQQFSGVDDWDAEFGGGNDVGGTTELDGLPPPPAGVTAAAAKNKGMDNYKQGQYPDAIKWLSWAVILFGKAADSDGTNEVLSSRASCYKEVGEYKKAVADCTKVLEHDDKNVPVLVQRALLYESMEKYKLGADDLRTVMKLDPGNRVAKSTIHRLSKMAEQ